MGSTPRLALSPAEAAQALGLSRTRIYELILSGEIPSAKIGRSRRIRHVDLEEYLERMVGA